MATAPSVQRTRRITPAQAEHTIRLMTRTWTRADLERLPPGNRYEILDGRLLLTPPAGELHRDLCGWFKGVLDGAAPDGWRIRWDIGVKASASRALIPDLVVMAPEVPKALHEWNTIVPNLVIEVESPVTRAVDRVDKAEAYAELGVESYWRVEGTGRVVVGDLDHGSYAETAYEPYEPFAVERPYPVSVPARPVDSL